MSTLACPGTLARHPLALVLFLLCRIPAACAEDFPEYQVKAEFLYRFAQFTEWPADVGGVLNLCVHGRDPFGAELDALKGKTADSRTFAVSLDVTADGLDGCQIVYVAPDVVAQVPRLVERLKGRPVLIVADTPGAARLGATLNMAVVRNHVTFEANMGTARMAGINLSSRLLRLASEVIP